MQKHLVYLWLLALLAGLTLSRLAFADEPLMVPAEVFQPAQLKNARSNETLKTAAASDLTSDLNSVHRANRPMTMALGPPNATELKKLQQQRSRFKVLQIGIQRDVPMLPDVADWVWTPVMGGQAGQFLIISEQATRLRALIRLQAELPAGVEIRIYTPDDTEHVHGPFTQAAFHKKAEEQHHQHQGEFWTPTVSGTTLGIEVFAPDNVHLADIKLTIPDISHMVYDLQSGQFRNESTFKSNFKLSSCDISIACAPGMWQRTAKSVARYIYTGSDGNSYLCSGTLIADQNTSTQIPYFITAAHCVSDPAVTPSMDFFWFYRESSCGADDATWVQSSGGADLLVSRVELDTTLVRLNNPPPSGVTLSGWVLDTFATNEAMSGIHHAKGDIKQYSDGKFSGYVDVSLTAEGYIATQNPQGDFTQVTWDSGVTAPGASGSGIWKTINSQHFLKGTLVGGSSSCDVPDSPDQYSRIERFYPFVKNWLGVSSLQGILDGQGALAGLTDGVMLARYMNGVRGNALLTGITTENVGISTLESRLQDAVNVLDIDENGSAETNRDGLLLIRYLLGLRGDGLIAGIDLTNSPNKTPAGIAAFIENVLANQ